MKDKRALLPHPWWCWPTLESSAFAGPALVSPPPGKSRSAHRRRSKAPRAAGLVYDVRQRAWVPNDAAHDPRFTFDEHTPAWLKGKG